MSKVISTRHIRHDWDRWFDNPDQNTVKTMCGVRSRTGLCGIPGITKQPEVVEKSGRRVWGWCMSCVRATWRDSACLTEADVMDGYTNQAVLDQYKNLRSVIAKQFYAGVLHQYNSAVKTNRPGTAKSLSITLQRVELEFPEVTATSCS